MERAKYRMRGMGKGKKRSPTNPSYFLPSPTPLTPFFAYPYLPCTRPKSCNTLTRQTREFVKSFVDTISNAFTDIYKKKLKGVILLAYQTESITLVFLQMQICVSKPNHLSTAILIFWFRQKNVNGKL